VEGTRLADGAHETIDAVADRAAAVGLLSNGEGDLQRAKLAVHDLADAFDAVVISNEVGSRKPDPEIFAIAEQRLADAGVEATEHVFVADEYETDIGPAEQAGWSAIHVRNDEGPSGSVNRVGSLAALLL
jgi:putative hydrolase of the HAD superfamily